MSFPLADVLLISSMASLPILYLAIPILLFRGKTVIDHLIARATGLVLAIALISVLFKWMTWAYWQEMHQIALFFHLLFTTVLFFLLVTHRKRPEKKKFYSRVAWRFLTMLLPLTL